MTYLKAIYMALFSNWSGILVKSTVYEYSPVIIIKGLLYLLADISLILLRIFVALIFPVSAWFILVSHRYAESRVILKEDES